MKKILAIVAMLGLAAGAVYAATDTAWHAQASGAAQFGDAAAGGVITFKPSANVAMAYDATNTQYTIGTVHLSGNKIFGTSSVETTIFYKPLTAAPGTVANIASVGGVTIPEASTVAIGDFAAGWTASK